MLVDLGDWRPPPPPRARPVVAPALPPSYYLAQALSRIAHSRGSRLEPADANKPKPQPKLWSGASSLDPCSGNIAACLYVNYRYHGGQVTSQGIPTGRGYHPDPSDSDLCGIAICHNAITGRASRVGLVPLPAVRVNHLHRLTSDTLKTWSTTGTG